jgi:hypothetical protein
MTLWHAQELFQFGFIGNDNRMVGESQSAMDAADKRQKFVTHCSRGGRIKVHGFKQKACGGS